MNDEMIKDTIRRIRKSLNLTQGEVAERAGISRLTYNCIEMGSLSLISDRLAQIAETLDTSVEQLLLGYIPAEMEICMKRQEIKETAEARINGVEEKYKSKVLSLKRTLAEKEEIIVTLGETFALKDELIEMSKARLNAI